MGAAGFNLPAEAWSGFENPPMVTCYRESPTPEPFWQLVSGSYTSSEPFCILGEQSGGWFVGMYNLNPGTPVAIVVHY